MVSVHERSVATDVLDRDLLLALGEPTRLDIVERLADGPSPVGELAAGLP